MPYPKVYAYMLLKYSLLIETQVVSTAASSVDINTWKRQEYLSNTFSCVHIYVPYFISNLHSSNNLLFKEQNNFSEGTHVDCDKTH